MSCERFWLEEPAALLKSTIIIPECGMTVAARLNALTRLILLITLLLWIFCVARWWLFLLFGLLLVVILFYLESNRRLPEISQQNQGYLVTPTIVENYVCSSRSKTARKSPILQERSDGFQPYN